MSGIVHLTAAHARRLPWRNGRGFTDELALGPAGATFERGDFDWRLARATVVDDGPFSAFPGFDRVLVITSGAGLILTHGDFAPRCEVRPWQPCAFSGDWPTEATRLAGPVTDLNLLARRGAVRAEVRLLGPGKHDVHGAVGSGQLLLHAAAGRTQARLQGETAARELAAGESLLVSGEAGGLSVVAGEGPALLVRLDPWAAAR
jgi:uncharacterized protein